MKKLVTFVKKNKFYLLGLAVLAFVVFINLFPKGYVFGGGDTIQLIDAKNSFGHLFYYSLNGSVSLFYFIFYLLNRLGVGDTIQLSFYLGIFIVGSYISFDAFSRLIFTKSKNLIRMLVSLFYALNTFTLFYFTGNWGFSHYLWLYIFIPILIGLFLKFLETEKFIFGVWFLFFLFLASSGFGNPAFFLSFSLFLVFLVIFFVVFKYLKPSKKLIFNLIILAMFYFLVNSFWIIPTIPQIKDGINNLNISTVITLDWALQHNTSSIPLTLSLAHPTKEYFPYDFPYQSMIFLKKFFVLLSFLPILVVLSGIFFWKKFEDSNEKKIFITLLAVLTVFTMLLVKVNYPFKGINNFIFHIWGMNTLRGVEKISIYIPFLLAFMIFIIANNFQKYKKLIMGFLVLIVLIPLPFFIGKIQQNISYRFPSKSNFQKYKLSFLIKIPQEYYNIQSIINNDKEKSFVATLPKTRNDGSGISDFPKWKFYGGDITQNLYRKKFIEANNTAYFKNFYFAEEFDKDSDGNYEWIPKLIGMMNSRYIIFHKDATKKYVEHAEPKMKMLEDEGAINKIQENDYFILYSIPDKFFLPYISWQKENILIEPNASSINNKFEKIKENLKTANFREINPRRFEVAVNEEAGDIILAEPFNANWKAYLVDADGKEKEIMDHFLARGYANGWKINDSVGIQKIIIEYYPIRLLWKGMAITGATILLLVIYLIRYYYKKRCHPELVEGFN
ncbi:MAG: hypothetical protein COU40_01885 [Candidatus Moranbacteria bacterium CG10_big_fil_rev_8_21_14_0_10_35_21]|nr:MAG: hypothetical protein COU40_01885 [Candidatus Moranbacteria bacterium CG10_big_fil_rev_8_21_14_0_10_35_21]PJA88249.1 MAG: hypothetical protein CO139_04160 [Candidatus Moranbacteria bacterium CG_4_9_14_3_um_filter_36_9]